jgi:hypothetical protein
MKLLLTTSQEEFEAIVIEIAPSDLKEIRKSKQFGFDWDREKPNHIFKIVKAGDDSGEIYGLISLSNISQELRIHINLIENSSDNRGSGKKVDRVAGCLLAFAVSLAFEKGYYGFTSLVPKTELIDLYTIKYRLYNQGKKVR